MRQVIIFIARLNDCIGARSLLLAPMLHSEFILFESAKIETII